MSQRYGPDQLADDMFTSFTKMAGNTILEYSKEEAQYFQNLTEMVNSSQGYNNTTLDGTDDGMTDWEFGTFELDEAASIYCGGGLASCYDEGQGSQGRFIGMLGTKFNKNKEIFNNTQQWIENFAGDGGWLDKIEKYQRSYTGKEGTGGAMEILTEIGNFRKEKDNMFKKGANDRYMEDVDALKDWIQQATALGQIDLSPGHPLLDYMESPFSPEVIKGFGGAEIFQKNPGWIQYYSDYAKDAELTNAVELLRLGDVQGSEAAHKRWMTGIDDRRAKQIKDLEELDDQIKADKQTAIDEKIEAVEEYDKNWQTGIAQLGMLEQNLKGSKGLAYHTDFKNATKQYFEGTALSKGALNEKTLPAFKNGLARNLASYMQWAEGSAKKEWEADLKRLRKIYPDLSDTEIEIKAVDAFFGPMNSTQMLKMAEGEWGFFGFGEGMDFPDWGWFGSSTKEKNAEAYMSKTFELWKDLYNMENDPRLKTDAIVPSSGTSVVDPMNMMNYKSNNKAVKTHSIFKQDSVWNDMMGGDSINNVLDSLEQQQVVPQDTTNINNPDAGMVDEYVPPLNAALDGSSGDVDMNQDSIMKAVDRKSRDVINLALDKGMTPDQIEAARPLIIKYLKENTDTIRPEAVWYITYADYLDSADTYQDLEEYLKQIFNTEYKGE